jgi:branched-chain amino acid transport system substrate-binding protein
MQRWCVAVFLLFITACAPAQDKPVIGAILPLSGPFAFYGQDAQQAMDIALEEVGSTVSIIYEDSAGENPKAVAAFNKLTNIDGSKMVISSTSWISNAVYSQAADQGVLQAIIASAGFKRSRKGDLAVRFTVDVKEELQYLVGHLEQFSRIGVLHLNNDYGKGWAEGFKQVLGEKIVAVEAYNPGDADVNSQLTKIKAANPDVLVLVSTGKEGGLFARRARELGLHVPLVSQRPIQSPELLEQAAAVEGMVYSYPAYDVNYPFIEKYVAKYGKQPTVFAVEAYDAVITLAQATESCKTDTSCLHKWFIDKEYDGALGHVKFDNEGDAHYPFVLKQVRSGSFVPYE